MSTPAGRFNWYELMTPDPDAVKGFYRDVVGWTITDFQPRPDGKDYRMIGRSDGKHAGGALRIDADMAKHGARPTWLAYLHVLDTDASVAAITADGGTVLMPAFSIPGVGRMAMVTDPQGVPFYLMTPTPPPGVEMPVSDVFSPDAVQRTGWNELSSPDLPAARTFYAKHFNFAFNESMDMGAMGPYCFIDHGGVRLGAMMQRQDERQPAAWLFYFRVPSIAEAARAVTAGGGTVLMGPHQVPTGEWIVIATDPAGAGFGLVGKA